MNPDRGWCQGRHCELPSCLRALHLPQLTEAASGLLSSVALRPEVIFKEEKGSSDPLSWWLWCGQ